MAIIGGFDVHRAGIALRAGCDVRRVFQLTVFRSWEAERAWGNLASATDLQSPPVIGRRNREFPNESVHRDPPESQFSRSVSSPFCSARSGRLTTIPNKPRYRPY